MSNPFNDYGKSSSVQYTDIHGKTTKIKVKATKKPKAKKQTFKKVKSIVAPKTSSYKFSRRSPLARKLRKIF